MPVVMNSDEYKAWHEVGHATVCLHLGGYLDSIEFLEVNSEGLAVARGCEVAPDLERHVACGGFATEYYLLQTGNIAGVDLNDPKAVEAVSGEVFSNCWRDHQEFIGRVVTKDNDFTRHEKVAFMHYAIEHVAPIIHQHFDRMKSVVTELLAKRKLSARRIKELLEGGSSAASEVCS